jgi:cell division transport system permease protein
MRLGFILGEVWAGLKSNVSMVVSIILVTFISLTFVGVAALLQLQIGQMKNYWYDRAQVAIYLCTDFSPSTACPLGAATGAQKNAISTQLGSTVLSPYIDTYYFESHEEAYQKFLDEFAGSAVASFITAEQLNEAYWVNLIDPEQSALITETFTGLGGVEEVRDQRGYLDQIFAFLNVGSITAAAIAGVMLISATLLISTTIKLSAFSRRREIGIMRLVGSSNFSIQLPFVLEGIAAAVAGSLLAIGAIFTITEYLVADFLAARLPFTSFVGFAEAVLVAPYLIGAGVILAALASGVSIRRYLKI